MKMTYPKPELVVLVDSRDYINGNNYMGPLYRTLDEAFALRTLELNDLQWAWAPGLMKHKRVLSLLKLKTLSRNLSWLVKTVADADDIWVYELDTPENYLVGSPFQRSYEKIGDALSSVGANPFAGWIVQSNWWRQRLAEDRIPATVVHPWPRPEQIVAEPVPWSQRKHDVTFAGSLQPHRQRFFERLQQLGLRVDVRTKFDKPQDYLDFVSNSRICVRSEARDETFDFGAGPLTLHVPNTLWFRDVEVAAMGTYSLREPDEEAEHWKIDDIPTIQSFEDPEGAVALVQHLLTDVSDQRHEEWTREGLDAIRRNDRHLDLVNYLGPAMEMSEYRERAL
jgi:hypothetical protein